MLTSVFPDTYQMACEATIVLNILPRGQFHRLHDCGYALLQHVCRDHSTHWYVWFAFHNSARTHNCSHMMHHSGVISLYWRTLRLIHNNNANCMQHPVNETKSCNTCACAWLCKHDRMLHPHYGSHVALCCMLQNCSHSATLSEHPPNSITTQHAYIIIVCNNIDYNTPTCPYTITSTACVSSIHDNSSYYSCVLYKCGYNCTQPASIGQSSGDNPCNTIHVGYILRLGIASGSSIPSALASTTIHPNYKSTIHTNVRHINDWTFCYCKHKGALPWMSQAPAHLYCGQPQIAAHTNAVRHMCAANNDVHHPKLQLLKHANRECVVCNIAFNNEGATSTHHNHMRYKLHARKQIAHIWLLLHCCAGVYVHVIYRQASELVLHIPNIRIDSAHTLRTHACHFPHWSEHIPITAHALACAQLHLGSATPGYACVYEQRNSACNLLVCVRV